MRFGQDHYVLAASMLGLPTRSLRGSAQHRAGSCPRRPHAPGSSETMLAAGTDLARGGGSAIAKAGRGVNVCSNSFPEQSQISPQQEQGCSLLLRPRALSWREHDQKLVTASLPLEPFRAHHALQLPGQPHQQHAQGWLCGDTTVLLTRHHGAPLTAGSHYCNVAFFFFFFFFLQPCRENAVSVSACSVDCRILSPSQGLLGCHCLSGESHAGSLSNITLILKLL